MKKAIAYMKKHSMYNAMVHAIGGIGIGILIASPFAGSHPVRWGLTFLIVSVLGHLYAWFAK
jgi:hypothetical protein